MIVAKAANMANMMEIPVVGLVENMSYFKCPDCGKEYKIFGESHITEVAGKFGYEVLRTSRWICVSPLSTRVCLNCLRTIISTARLINSRR